jgi:antitoxin ParD1/3/4
MTDEREKRLAELDRLIAAGLADANAGRVHDIEDVRRRLIRKLTRLQSQKK